MAQFSEQQLVDPSDISRSLKQVLGDVCAAWCLCDHTKGVDGHLFNGLSNRLDGSEDWKSVARQKPYGPKWAWLLRAKVLWQR